MARETASPATAETFRSYVPAATVLPEFTVRAVLLGMAFGIIFGAVTVYVGLRAGLTVSASIPIAVLSISLLRALGRATILENNIVQTTGSAGESVAAGVIFTLPALVFLGFPLHYSRIFFLALIGGWLGVLFMIPLRRQLIVKEHGNLLYPEGTACADVLIAGEKGGSFASRVFWGLGLGGVYTLFQNGNAFAAIKETPTYDPGWLPGASLRAAITSEYLGVGYIIGPRVAGTIFAGGVFSWLVMMPAIKFFGSLVPTAIYPSPIPIAQMTSDQLWNYYIRYIGAGSVAAAGLITLVKTLPTIVGALKAGASELAKGGGDAAPLAGGRIARDLPLTLVLAGSGVIVLLLWVLLVVNPVPGAQIGLLDNALAALLVVLFGFLFVTVSSRICGLIGTSANPVSGMTIATLMATCALFLAAGWTTPAYAALALSIGGIVCIAAANAGATSQDLKTGYLVGATPYYQQIGLFAGVTASAFIIGLTLIGMNKGLEKYEPVALALDAGALPEGVVVEGTKEHEGR
ncbi:MAG TPA: oligopeptide transporter, OPT family, partial [Vicinamibacteria bacterium]|nr:oligopeptide transporter, OPT family [Vicinamibacteria bacterium]